MKIYVIAWDYSFEGYAAPEAAYATREAAEEAIKGKKTGAFDEIPEIFELEVQGLEYEYGVMSRQAFAAAYNHAHARSMVESDVRYQGWKVVRRTKTGPWEEVES